MHIHEYQAKDLLRRYGVPVPAGHEASSLDGAVTIAEREARDDWVVKAQVHTGGRGKAGGVVRVADRAELERAVGRLLGSRLVTHQTGPRGQPVGCVLLEAPTVIRTELYLAILVDRASERIALVASAEGGTEIEELAASRPEAIVKVLVDPAAGLQGFHARRLAFALGLEPEVRKQLLALVPRLYRAFVESDLGLLEINPLVVDGEGTLLALDAKVNVDDNALGRQQELAALLDASQEDPKETRAREHDLNYIALDGDIACMVNGAGLAMATMDIIKLHGGAPANFLDVGGGTTAARVAEAFKIILADDKVKTVLVNIFGGIVRCDLIAEGILAAAREVGLTLPVVVRLEGTNVEQGRALLEASDLPLISAEGLAEAARLAVGAARGEGSMST